MYLIDGNNVIGGRVGWHRDKEGARLRLIRELAVFVRVRKIRLTVVFDGAPDPAFPEGASHRGVRILYARKGSDADTRIIEMVEAERNRKNLVVITSDGRLLARVRVCGVRVLRAGEFRRLLDETLADAPARANPEEPADNDMDSWMRYFGVDPDEEDDEPFLE
ncbi:MAG: NYN domain-containing protein [Blastocatellia bacterium]|nr:NYN domain-containing protein [Blastocatellia bacterium]